MYLAVRVAPRPLVAQRTDVYLVTPPVRAMVGHTPEEAVARACRNWLEGPDLVVVPDYQGVQYDLFDQTHLVGTVAVFDLSNAAELAEGCGWLAGVYSDQGKNAAYCAAIRAEMIAAATAKEEEDVQPVAV